MAAEPGPRERKAFYETKNFGESLVRWGGLCALGEGGAEHERFKVGVLNRTLQIQDIERDGESQYWESQIINLIKQTDTKNKPPPNF